MLGPLTHFDITQLDSVLQVKKIKIIYRTIYFYLILLIK